MDPPKLTMTLVVTGRDDRPEELAWLKVLPGLRGSHVQRLMIVLPSWWECSDPGKNLRIRQFVNYAKVAFPLRPSILGVRRFPEWESWLRPEHWDHIPSAYSAWDWYVSMRHLDECAKRFGIAETFLDAEAFGHFRDIVDFKHANLSRLRWTLRVANARRILGRIPKPDWARPGDAYGNQPNHVNYVLGTVGKHAATDTLRLCTTVPRAWRAVPPWHDGKVRMWLSYMGDGGLTVDHFRTMNWVQISRDLGSTAMERFPQTVVLRSDIPNTLRTIERLAEWRAG